MVSINKTHRIGNFDLRFFSEVPSWCQIFVKERALSTEHYLGGDSVEIIKERLADKIDNIGTLPSKVKIQNRNVCWLISLMDGHASVFLSNEKPFSFFIVFDDKGLENPLEIAAPEEDVKSFCKFVRRL